jgi:WD40 repeat protein
LVELHAPLTELGQSTWTFAAPAFSSDGKMVAAGSKDNNGYVLNVYEVRDDLSLHAIVRNITGRYTLAEFSFDFSDDGKYLVCIDDIQLIMTSPRDWSKCPQFRCEVTFTYKTMHGGSYQLPSGDLVSDLNLNTSNIDFYGNKFSPDNAYFANLSSRFEENRDGWFYVQVWQVDNGELYRRLDAMPFKMGEDIYIDFSPGGELLGIVGGGKLRIWQWEPNTFLWTQDGIFSALDYSPDGSVLATGAPDGTIQLLKASDGTTLTTLSGHRHAITYLAFSPDGSLLASLDETGKLMLWSVPH